MKIAVSHSCPDYRSYRAARVKSLFNVEAGNSFSIEVELPLEQLVGWRIGMVVGPSGSGKTSIGARLAPDGVRSGLAWPEDRPVIDVLPGDFDQATAALSAVGLGSVPAWLRPYRVLSNGERFRADLARIICEQPRRVVIDEFTSVVDRQIARIGAMAFAKAWRRTGGEAVLLSCHYDIIRWVRPDWLFDTASGEFTGRYLRKRPRIALEIHETDWRWWPLFEPHHYLKLPRMIAATCYVGFVGDAPVAHLAVSTRPGLKEARACRLVIMPEWQGAGVGLRFLNAVAARWRRGLNRYARPMPTLFHTSHPGLAAALRRDPLWAQVSAGLVGANKLRSRASIMRSGGGSESGYGGHFRAVQGFRFVEGL